MDDREVVAAIRSEDLTGLAAAYEEYAAGLYDYCHWMLGQPIDAAEALQETFVIAAAREDLPKAAELRPWLYSVARRECLRRRRGAGSTADRPAGVDDDDFRTLIRAVLAELKPSEREVIELQFRHGLDDADLTVALGVSWSRAHAWAVRSRSSLDKALRVLLAARTGREICADLDAMLPDRDEPLTEATRNRVAEHIQRCGTCAIRQPGPLRPTVLSDLLPLAPFPSELKDQVLRACSEGPTHRCQVAGRPRSTWVARWPQAIRQHWAGIRHHTRPATMTMVFAGWVVAVWAVAAVLFFVVRAP